MQAANMTLGLHISVCGVKMFLLLQVTEVAVDSGAIVGAGQ